MSATDRGAPQRIEPEQVARRPRLSLVAPIPSAPADEVRLDTPTSGRTWMRRFRTRLRVSDALVVSTAVTAGMVGVAMVPRSTSISSATVGGDLVIALAVIVTWLGALAALHTRDARVLGVGALEYKRVANASALAFGLLAIVFLLLQVENARIFFVIALPLGLVGLLLDRWMWRKWLLRQRRFGHYLSRAVVVGSRAEVEYVAAQIEKSTGASYVVVGAVLDDNPSSGSLRAAGREVPIISDVEHIATGASAVGADAVIVAGHPNDGGHFIRTLGWDLEGTHAELVLASRLTDIAGPRIHFRPVEGLPLIHVEIPTFEGGKHLLKRTVDISLSTIALIVLMPLLLLVALAVRLDSPGAALFRQERCGRSGRIFRMLKFRSMVLDAEEALPTLSTSNDGSGLLFKLREDPRVTRVGRIIRKYSLDELPQIWNVLIGDMSIVGPRPPLAAEVECYEAHTHRRLFIKPGITGLWQISGRSDLDWDESVRLDLYYVENWSLTGDLMIIWRTFRTILKPVGAY